MLKEILKKDMITFMKEKRKNELNTIRMINSAIKNKEIELKRDLTDNEIIALLHKEVKQYQESIEGYTKKGNTKMVEELIIAKDLVTKYLPKQLTDEEAKTVIKEKLSDLEITSKADFGKAMKFLKDDLAGKVAPSKISEILKEIL